MLVTPHTKNKFYSKSLDQCFDFEDLLKEPSRTKSLESIVTSTMGLMV